MAKALALVCLLFIAAVSATETEAETERPTVKPIIVGVVPRAGSKYLKGMNRENETQGGRKVILC